MENVMKVKIRGAMYDSENEPVMVVLSQDEKVYISEMEGEMYCNYPDDLDPDKVREWMESKGPMAK
jgi:hypothetical protein